jgi:hypothetical protein
MSLQIEFKKDVNVRAVAVNVLGGTLGEPSSRVDPKKLPKSIVLQDKAMMVDYSLNDIPLRVLFEPGAENSAGVVSSADFREIILPGQLTTSFPGILVQGVSL